MKIILLVVNKTYFEKIIGVCYNNIILVFLLQNFIYVIICDISELTSTPN